MNTISQNTNLEKTARRPDTGKQHNASSKCKSQHKENPIQMAFREMRLFEKNKTHKHKLLAFFVVTRPKTKSGHETGPQGTDSSLDP